MNGTPDEALAPEQPANDRRRHAIRLVVLAGWGLVLAIVLADLMLLNRAARISWPLD